MKEQVFGDWVLVVILSIMALCLRLPTICFPQRLSPNSTPRMSLNPSDTSRVSFPDFSFTTKKSDQLTDRKLPILLFDIMDTIVRDPFYHDVPAFFRYQNFLTFFFFGFCVKGLCLFPQKILAGGWNKRKLNVTVLTFGVLSFIFCLVSLFSQHSIRQLVNFSFFGLGPVRISFLLLKVVVFGQKHRQIR